MRRMLYADEYPANGIAGFFDDIFRDVATGLGLRDPITHYEGKTPLPEVFAKYSMDIDYHRSTLPLLGSPTKQKELSEKLSSLERLRNELRPAFKPGARPGERDRDRLAKLVQGTRNYRKEWHDAKKRFGMREAQIQVPVYGPPTPDKERPSILPLALAAAAAFFILR